MLHNLIEKHTPSIKIDYFIVSKIVNKGITSIDFKQDLPSYLYLKK